MIEKFELYKYSDYAASDYAWSTVYTPGTFLNLNIAKNTNFNYLV